MSISSSAVLTIDDVDEGYEINSRIETDFGIEMKDIEGYKGLFAKESFIEASVIFYLKGRVSIHPNKYSIQLDRNKHLDFPTDRKANDDLDYAWQYLNHSCEPNGYMNTAEYTFRALRKIRRGEEITFNYLTTEYELATPFSCHCGSAGCLGFIQGNRYVLQPK
jgi:hypothetical protein